MNPLGLFFEPPGPLLTHLHTVYMAYSECLPTRLNPLAERACFFQAGALGRAEFYAAMQLVAAAKQSGAAPGGGPAPKKAAFEVGVITPAQMRQVSAPQPVPLAATRAGRYGL